MLPETTWTVVLVVFSRKELLIKLNCYLNNILSNDNDWTLPEPTPKKRGILFLSPEDMQEAKKSMKEKGIKAEDVKNLPPIEEIHGLNIPHVEETHALDNPTQVVKVNSLYRYDKVEILSTKFASECLVEFDDFMARQESFNAYVGRELKNNAFEIGRVGDNLARELKMNFTALANMLLWLLLKLSKYSKLKMICLMN